VLDDLRPGEELVVEPFAGLAATGRFVPSNEGFWASMDAIRDMRTLEDLNESGAPPWAVWRAPYAGRQQ
jgi:hypothetical protein